ncbi:hypothetical protein QBC39DRAFT_379307 [Podospora conica]|nr:hypothetical protein QBC39DRAFT_379307 [Schizothecium conicum]
MRNVCRVRGCEFFGVPLRNIKWLRFHLRGEYHVELDKQQGLETRVSPGAVAPQPAVPVPVASQAVAPVSVAPQAVAPVPVVPQAVAPAAPSPGAPHPG